MPVVKGHRGRPSLPSRWAIIALASVATAFIPSLSHAAQAALVCPPGTVQAGDQFVTEVTIDVGTTPLGSYGVTLTYDGSILRVASVAGGTFLDSAGATQTFSTVPHTNVCTGNSCQTLISGFQSCTTCGPSGGPTAALGIPCAMRLRTVSHPNRDCDAVRINARRPISRSIPEQCFWSLS